MSKKKSHKSNKSISDKQKIQPQKNSKKKPIGIVLIFSVLLLTTVGFGAFAQWRGLILNNDLAEKKGVSTNLAFVQNQSTNAPAQPFSSPQYEAGEPSKEYVYANGKLIAVSEPIRPLLTDLAVWRVSTGTWWILHEDGSHSAQQWGLSTDIPAPGDYDGDGKTDACIFRPSEGKWYISLTGSNYALAVYPFGMNGDEPVPADYDNDGITDLAVYRDSDKTWHVYKIGPGEYVNKQFGIAKDKTVQGDYDGDGKADYAMWRNSTGSWHVWQSSSNSEVVTYWGISGDKPVQGDYDGDGKIDHAVWRNDNTWYVLQSSDGNWLTVNLGVQSSDIAVPGDYDADGKTDVAYWRPSNGNWYIKKSSTGASITQLWGTNGDIPVPAAYRRTN